MRGGIDRLSNLNSTTATPGATGSGVVMLAEANPICAFKVHDMVGNAMAPPIIIQPDQDFLRDIISEPLKESTLR